MRSREGLGRREFLSAALGAGVAAAACRRRPVSPEFEGRLLGQSLDVGHRLRDREALGAPLRTRKVGTLIVGAGAAGLSAGWRLLRAKEDDFVILELEPRIGGTSSFDLRSPTPVPWGAHYLPVPGLENRSLVALLREMGVVQGVSDEGELICAEEVLCRAPQERLFFKGRWYDGLYLRAGASTEDLRQAEAFSSAMQRFAERRDASGKRTFTLPVASGSEDSESASLDGISMAEFLDRHGWTSPRLRWLVDYACRDDYGLRVEETSAWAGVFYFSARQQAGSPSELLTWPEGNGRLVRHLSEACGERVRTGWAVADVRPVTGGVQVDAFEPRAGVVERWMAERVVYAGPTFLRRHLIAPERDEPPPWSNRIGYGSWVVANVSLRDRPRSHGFPLAWDNVLYESDSLGYVVATHQQGRDHGPTVWTWYLPLCGKDPRVERELLLESDWKRWADAVVSDLRPAHVDLAPLIDRIDVWRWGHAMVRPVPGLLSSGVLAQAQRPRDRIHFAHTDLSGMALFEEAHFHGVRAAEEVLSAGGRTFESLL